MPKPMPGPLSIYAIRPTVTLSATTQIDGVNEWLFMVIDGSSRLVASGSSGGQVVLAVIDPVELVDGAVYRPASSWKAPGINAGAFVSSHAYTVLPDHWHVYDGTYHWIAACLDGANGATGVGVARVDDSFAAVTEWVYDAGKTEVKTQDLWCIENHDGSGGIAIAVVRNGDRANRALKILLVDASFNVTEAGEWAVAELSEGYGCGGSATWDAATNQYRILAPQQMSACQPNPIYLLEVSSDWSSVASSTDYVFLSKDTTDPTYQDISGGTADSAAKYAYVMCTEAVLDGGYRAVAVRRVTLTTSDAEASWTPDALCGACCVMGNPDDSPIYLLILDLYGYIIQEELVIDVGQRPHILLTGGVIYVCYDHEAKCYVATFELGQEEYLRAHKPTDLQQHGYKLPEGAFASAFAATAGGAGSWRREGGSGIGRDVGAGDPGFAANNAALRSAIGRDDDGPSVDFLGRPAERPSRAIIGFAPRWHRG